MTTSAQRVSASQDQAEREHMARLAAIRERHPQPRHDWTPEMVVANAIDREEAWEQSVRRYRREMGYRERT